MNYHTDQLQRYDECVDTLFHFISWSVDNLHHSFSLSPYCFHLQSLGSPWYLAQTFCVCVCVGVCACTCIRHFHEISHCLVSSSYHGHNAGAHVYLMRYHSVGSQYGVCSCLFHEPSPWSDPCLSHGYIVCVHAFSMSRHPGQNPLLVMGTLCVFMPFSWAVTQNSSVFDADTL